MSDHTVINEYDQEYIRDKSMQSHVPACITACLQIDTRGHGNAINTQT